MSTETIPSFLILSHIYTSFSRNLELVDSLYIDNKTKEKKEEEGYIYRERHSGRYYRAVSLPSTIDPDNAKASYKNGVLEIKMPKSEVKKKRSLEIE